MDNYNYEKKKYLYIKMLNNTPKITTYRQRYRERKRKNVLKKVDGIIKKTKKGYKKWLVIETTHFLMKKKKREYGRNQYQNLSEEKNKK